MWCIAKGENAAFVAAMEDILDLYCQPYDADDPVVCMDEKPYQLLGEIREPIPMRPGKPLKVDAEYVRNGACSIFVFTEPLRGWRYANAHERRTKVDWAMEIRWLPEEKYPQAKKVRLVSDNLNTQRPSRILCKPPNSDRIETAWRLQV